MREEAVITGLGTIGAAGQGSAVLAAALAAGIPLAAPVERGDRYHREEGARLAAMVGQRNVSEWVPPLATRRMSFPSRITVAAGRMALTDAGLDKPRMGQALIGVYLSTAFGSVLATEKLLRLILVDGAEAAQPFLYSECVANAIAAQLAIAVGARGPNVTLTQREAGPLLAVARAAQAVREGRVEIALAGAIEEVTPLLHAMLDRFGALARADGSREEMPRPFDCRRNGFLLGEGSSIVVIEREAAAQARGARILARVGWSGAAFDPTAPVSDWGDGDGQLAETLREGLDGLAHGPAGIDAIISGASGAVRGDRLEARVLRSTWDNLPLPPVLAPKAIVGEYGGGILAPALLALTGCLFGPTPGFEQVDPECGLTPFDGKVRVAPSCVLLTGLASGGAAAWMVLEKVR